MKYVDRTPKGHRIIRKNSRCKMWTLRKRVNYKDHFFNLGYDRKKARLLADKIAEYLVFHSVEDTRLHFYPKEVMTSDSVPTIRQVMEMFKVAAKSRDLSKRTIQAYISALRSLAAFNITYLDPDPKIQRKQLEEALEQLITSINPMLCNRARDIRLRDCGDTLATKRTFNSILTNAQAMFSPELTALYPNWNPVWIEPFLKVKGFRKVAKRYTLPPTDLIQRTFTELAQIDGPVWVCMTLALRAGLRRNEIVHARQSWLKPEGMMTKLYVYPEDDFTPKGLNGFTEMPTSVVKDILNVAGDCKYLLGIEKKYYRTEAVPAKAVELLREWGWQDYKSPLHELRKLFGAVISTTQGLYTAQKYLRHSGPQITSDSYADLVETQEVVDLWAM